MTRQLKGFFATMAMLLSFVAGAAESDIIISHSNAGQGMAPYLGINLGSANYDLANDSSPSYSIFGGVALNDLLAIELGFVDFGDVDVTSIKSEASAVHGSAMANVGLSNELSAFVQVGLARWNYDSGAASDSSIDVFFGGGLNYEVRRNLAARFAVQRFAIDANIANTAMDEAILNVSLGILYRF
ncbi:MAG: outer membrane beta-barrel protein [Gammaproteobacteria bacterium]|nr:outer membrane beta-barrel protein [Gammaproteobacteria bacterium]